VWSADVGQGFSAVAVAGGKLYTMGNRGERDTVHCFDAATGKPVWAHSYRCGGGEYGGPRATPTIDGTAVYTMSREALAVCLNAATGKVIWTRDLRKETGGEIPRWGFAGSPLVRGGRIFYNVGGAGIALDGRGNVVWKSRGGTAGYSSPVPFRVGNQEAVLLFTGPGLVAVNAQNGRQLWDFPWNTSYDVNAADPIVVNGNVFISSNYNTGCALLKVGAGRPSVLWQNRNMRNHFNSCVLLGGALFGNDENTLKCIDVSSGQERWRSRGIGKGGLIAANGKLIVLTERGELVVAGADAAAYRELARARVIDGMNWTHPVLANRRIYCRSHEGKLVCLDVRARA
jgi:outer membrane protein assembly factor BamB